jgi:hypothetical protein
MHQAYLKKIVTSVVTSVVPLLHLVLQFTTKERESGKQ